MYDFDDDDVDSGVDYEDDWDNACSYPEPGERAVLSASCTAGRHCATCVRDDDAYCCTCGEPLA